MLPQAGPRPAPASLFTNCCTRHAKELEEKDKKAPAGDDPEPPAGDDPEPPEKKPKPPAQVSRTSFSCRPGESEAQRRTRVRAESSTRRERDQQQRADDERLRYARQRAPATPQPGWRNPAPRWEPGETAVDRARRVDGFFARLEQAAAGSPL